MPSERKISIDYVMEKASGLHFSGLHSTTATASSSLFSNANAPKQPFVIGVSGGTASGKTTVCDLIIQQLHDHRVVLVNQDSFYRGLTAEELKRVHEYNFEFLIILVY
ncbi:uridine/cytidine kinase 2, uridine kinase-like 2 [Hibiscus trionum]|uniref:Uridine/cytidine kinase 2, uridine kinase-like 2 n=1 Tax=Hibiscus trionum TaxID=183268 RepID=A0A9W7MTN2_HIBTR|nr:uridine/cytidine kinase 2, uridine kinase-like 2 [Hibiscus trionum]